MTKENLWREYVRQNRALNERHPVVHLSASAFRKFFDTTYDAAYRQGAGSVDSIATLRGIFR